MRSGRPHRSRSPGVPDSRKYQNVAQLFLYAKDAVPGRGTAFSPVA